MPQIDPFADRIRSFDSPCTEHFAIVPQDDADLPKRPRVLKALTDGAVAVRDSGDTVITYPVTAGEVLQFSAVGVEATGTTATVVGWL
ncbi:spike base protein, RCAP_Rcc01079 family [Epibacterium ulvae]|uniref:spike base protein, RCAP_Rcc01079 family n=1 Tax=Epibacterium ulvae TaxID=1156985 RepID=UPI00248FE7D4|nr:hypothetical protein [Epibacterium ulvae]